MFDINDLNENQQVLYEELITANLIDDTIRIIDSAGRYYRLKDLMIRNARTAIANDLLDNTLNLMKYYDQELCFSSYLPDCSTLCLNFQKSKLTKHYQSLPLKLVFQ